MFKRIQTGIQNTVDRMQSLSDQAIFDRVVNAISAQGRLCKTNGVPKYFHTSQRSGDLRDPVGVFMERSSYVSGFDELSVRAAFFQPDTMGQPIARQLRQALRPAGITKYNADFLGALQDAHDRAEGWRHFWLLVYKMMATHPTVKVPDDLKGMVHADQTYTADPPAVFFNKDGGIVVDGMTVKELRLSSRPAF